MGVSGRAMLDALVEGTKDAEAVAELARGSLRKKIPLLKAALEGHFTAHHAVMVSHMLGHIEYLEEALATLSRELETRLEPFRRQIELLKTIPGVQDRTAEMILGEVGVDMDQFLSAAHLASWAGVCPGNRRSAEKRQLEKTRKGGRWLKPALLEALG
jgi:transposase